MLHHTVSIIISSHDDDDDCLHTIVEIKKKKKTISSLRIHFLYSVVFFIKKIIIHLQTENYLTLVKVIYIHITNATTLLRKSTGDWCDASKKTSSSNRTFCSGWRWNFCIFFFNRLIKQTVFICIDINGYWFSTVRN